MRAIKPITIVGGGLAGLTLGISLRRLRVPVTIWEAGHYPRHRVCGEFISGQGLEALRRLNLLDLFLDAGATPARSARFFMGTISTPLRPVQPAALCLSRFTMDRLLADAFRALGGDLHENTRWEKGSDEEGIVRATGRRVRPTENGWRWFGLKVHAQGVQLQADLEMHGDGHGYVGLCRLPAGKTNVCGLFRSRRGTAGPSAMELLRGGPGTSLHQRLAGAVLDEASFCSVAGLPLRPQHALDQTECRIGDALTMVPPVTGNGMSMAFEAAELVQDSILAYARGELDWQAARQVAARACDRAFRGRLLWAKRLQAMMFSPIVKGRLGAVALNSRWLWQLVFARTR